MSSTSAGEKNVDYLICKQCHTPCYIFEMDGDIVTEAQCITCGNEAKDDFDQGDIEDGV